MKTTTIRHYGEFRRAADAVAFADGWEDLTPILVGRRYLAVESDEADRLAEAGVSFSHVGYHDGRLVTVPVN